MSNVKKHKEGLSFEVWCQRELSRLLQSQVDSEQVQYLLSIKGRKDLKEYLDGLLGTEVAINNGM